MGVLLLSSLEVLKAQRAINELYMALSELMIVLLELLSKIY